MNTIILPWPDSRYYPNNFRKLHWGTQTQLAASARFEGATEARQSKLQVSVNDEGVLPVTLEFTPPKRRGIQPDDDAMISMIKSHRDGIADVIGIDDNKWRINKPVIHPREGRGQVKVVFG